MKGQATLSPCGTYRYWLWRQWDAALPEVSWIMLNPSTADASKDDPTIRRVIGFSKQWGFGGVNVFNLFALRATNPDELKSHADPIGPENDEYLRSVVTPIRIAAWGVHGSLRGRDRAVRRIFGDRLCAMPRTRDGHPGHPLYLPKGATFTPFPPPAEFELA